uniref:GTP-binding protein n=1 Tax=Arcella intermedia TaxID=1963864 RepID=A0A6B2LMA6_9EUKA
MGDMKVGKTSLYLRYFKNSIDTFEYHLEFSFKVLNVSNQMVKLLVWDLYDFRQIRAPSLFQGANGFFVVFDLSQRETFRRLQHWREVIERYAPPQPSVLLVGNKADLERKVSREEAQKLAEEWKWEYVETSVLGDTSAVSSLFTKMAEQLNANTAIEVLEN